MKQNNNNNKNFNHVIIEYIIFFKGVEDCAVILVLSTGALKYMVTKLKLDSIDYSSQTADNIRKLIPTFTFEQSLQHLSGEWHHCHCLTQNCGRCYSNNIFKMPYIIIPYFLSPDVIKLTHKSMLQSHCICNEWSCTNFLPFEC